MYDVQTILSAYDKQGTLVQWLKNLDEILKNSGLETIEKVDVENGVKLVFKFAGGTTIESPVINKINTLDIEADSVKLALTDRNGVLIEYYTTLTVNGENVESNIKILFPIKGSESVIVDVDEDGTAIEIHLDADILNDISRSLKIPLVNPSATELVAVTASKEQKMLTVGNGLKIENDTLSTEATGGGGLTKTKVTLAELQSMLKNKEIPNNAFVAGMFVENIETLNMQNVQFSVFGTVNYESIDYEGAIAETALVIFNGSYNSVAGLTNDIWSSLLVYNFNYNIGSVTITANNEILEESLISEFSSGGAIFKVLDTSDRPTYAKYYDTINAELESKFILYVYK